MYAVRIWYDNVQFGQEDGLVYITSSLPRTKGRTRRKRNEYNTIQENLLNHIHTMIPSHHYNPAIPNDTDLNSSPKLLLPLDGGRGRKHWGALAQDESWCLLRNGAIKPVHWMHSIFVPSFELARWLSFNWTNQCRCKTSVRWCYHGVMILIIQQNLQCHLRVRLQLIDNNRQ